MLSRTLAKPSPAEVSRPSVDEVLAAVETKQAQWAEPHLIEQIAARVAGPPATIAAVIEQVRGKRWLRPGWSTWPRPLNLATGCGHRMVDSCGDAASIGDVRAFRCD